MMNLENTKVYSKEEDVIKKIQKITGLDIYRDVLIHDDDFGCLVIRDYAICIALKNSPTELDDVNYQVVTPEQINALYAEKFGIKTETPEESEAFDAIAQVDGEEWKNGDCCYFKGERCFFVGMQPLLESNIVGDCIVQHENGAPMFPYVDELSKPETPQQREEREQINAMTSDLWGKELSLDASELAKILYNLGYRKQSK